MGQEGIIVAGVPIAFCFGLGALCFLSFSTSVPIFVMIGRMDEGMSSLILLSVPIFVLLGCVLDSMDRTEGSIEQFKLIYERDIGYRDVADRVDAYYASLG